MATILYARSVSFFKNIARNVPRDALRLKNDIPKDERVVQGACTLAPELNAYFVLLIPFKISLMQFRTLSCTINYISLISKGQFAEISFHQIFASKIRLYRGE